MSKYLQLIVIFATTFLLSAGSASAAEYYVSPSGNDSNNGSQSSPWRSAERAGEAANPGDTVYFRAGSYTDTNSDNYVLRPARSGTSSAPITFRSYPGETAIFERAQTLVNLSDRSYIVLDGFTLRDVTANWGNWIFMENTSHSTLQNLNCTFTDRSTGVGWEGVRMINASYNRILNSRFDKWGIYGDPYNNGGDMVQMREGSHHNLVEGNDFGNAGHAALQIDGGYLNVIRKNTFHNTIEKNLELTFRNNTTANLFRWNLVEENDFRAGGYNSELHGGMHIHLNSSYNMVRRNIMRDGGSWAVDMQVWDTETQATQGNRLFHNTVVHNGIWQNRLPTTSGTGFEINDFGYTGSPQGSHVIKNNIFFDNLPVQGNPGTGGNVILYVALLSAGNRPAAPWYGVVIAGNLLYGRAANERVLYSSGAGDPDTVAAMQSRYPSNIYGNYQVAPSFVAYNPGTSDDPNDGTFDLHLQSGSAGIDQGVDLTTTTAAGSGTTITVADALYFHDGFDGLIAPDSIRVGSETVTVSDINYSTNQITVNRSITWAANAPVNLAYQGNRPDIGAYESGMTGTTPTPTPTPAATPVASPVASPTVAPTIVPTVLPSISPVSPSPVPTTSTVDCRADVDKNKLINSADYSLIITNFFRAKPTTAGANINGDGTVDLSDYAIFAANFGKSGC